MISNNVLHISLISFRLRNFNVFRVAVNIGPKKDIWFNLTYQEMLYRGLGSYRHVIDLSPNQVVRDFKLDVHVEESRSIRLVKVPPLLTSTATTPDGNAGKNPLISFSFLYEFGKPFLYLSVRSLGFRIYILLGLSNFTTPAKLIQCAFHTT